MFLSLLSVSNMVDIESKSKNLSQSSYDMKPDQGLRLKNKLLETQPKTNFIQKHTEVIQWERIS